MLSEQDIIKMFRSVYPEPQIQISRYEIHGSKAIIEAYFPDGVFYFVVTKNSVSSAYNSYDYAIKQL